MAAVRYELADEQVHPDCWTGRDLTRVKEAFKILKRKIASSQLLHHPGRTSPFVIIPHANWWAVCVALGQKYDRVDQPVRFTGRILNAQVSVYHIAEKEAVAIMRVWICPGYSLNVRKPWSTRYSVLSWLLKYKPADDRCTRWGGGLFALARV